MTLNELADWPVDNVSALLIDGPSFGDLDSPYELMSVTKLLSAWAFFVAIEEGVFELDQPLGPPGSTVRHLLAHASGVGFDDRTQTKPAGTRRIYSSAGFEILAEEVERVAEMPFAQYLAEAVFEPLGMASSRLYGSAGHGATSTVRDLERFARELLTPSLIAPETAREAFTVQFPALNGIVPGYGMHKPCPWGLGFEIHDHKSPHWMGSSMPADAVGHFGISGTFLWVVPSQGKAAIVLTDRDFGDWAKPLWSDFNERLWTA